MKIKNLVFFVVLWSLPTLANDMAFKQILEAEWQFRLQANPIHATRQGEHAYNHLLPDVSSPALAAQYQKNKDFLQQLKAIERSSLSASQQANYDLLKWVIQDRIADYELGAQRVPINTFSSFYSQAVRILTDAPLKTLDDYEDYLARIQALPTYFAQHTAHMRQGLEDGFTLPAIVIEGILPTLEAQVYKKASESPLFKAFTEFPSAFTREQQQQLRQRGEQAILLSANRAFKLLVDFFSKEYLPKTRQSVGAYQMSNGQAYYAHQIKKYVTTTDYSAEDIHAIGLAEVKRIKNEMLALIEELEFDGSFEEFVQFLRTDPQFYAQTEEDLLKEASYIAKRIDIRMPGFFGKLPRLPYGVEPVPDAIAPNYTTAAYWNASIGSDKGGAYVVNTYALDQRPLYELTALTLHEAVPGHHHQIALTQELENVARFRRSFYLSAFGEGWGLYSEKLGIEMGVYQNAYEHFGRLSYEMWRACRLVIDTGIHAKGWSRQQGLDFLADNTSLSLANVRAEVDRYISWPGQALAYKMGELKIWELRRKAEQALGESFDIRGFHDAILQNGAVPLVTLEQQINDFIAAEKK